MHYYQHHIGDFVRDTANLTDSQTVAYLRLIWRYYDTEQPLENDLGRLAFAVGSDDATVLRLLQHYFVLDADAWHHRRIDAEIVSYRSKSEKARCNAIARWNGDKSMRPHASGMRPHSDSKASAKLSQGFSSKVDANQEPITNISPTDVGDKKAKPFSGKPDDVTDATWSAFSSVRKTKRAAITDLAISGIRREASKAGVSLEQALTVCCEKGWASFSADWNGATASGNNRAARGPKPENFEDRDYGVGVTNLKDIDLF